MYRSASVVGSTGAIGLGLRSRTVRAGDGFASTGRVRDSGFGGSSADVSSESAACDVFAEALSCGLVGEVLSAGALCEEAASVDGVVGCALVSAPLAAAPLAAGVEAAVLAAASGMAGAGFAGLAFAGFGVAACGGAGFAGVAFGVEASGVAAGPGVLAESVELGADTAAGVGFRKLNPPCFHRKYPNPPIRAKAITITASLPQPRFGSSSSSSR